MDYTITYEQLDRLMKPYWDEKFKGTELGEIENYSEDEDWFGVIKGDNILVGYPSLDDGHMWFSNGEYFDGGWDMFNISSYEFNQSMLRYLVKKFEDIDIVSIA